MQPAAAATTSLRTASSLGTPPEGGDAASALGDAVTLSADAQADAAINRPAIALPKNVLTPLERAAVSVAAQAAATEQDSLAPLFANLGAAVSASNLPPKLQAAIAQVLAQQTNLDQNLDGGDIKTAFQKSGIFLEASLAAGTIPASGVPDLKAALIVLRQTLQTALGANSPATAPATQATPTTPGGAPQAAQPQTGAAPLVPSPSIYPDVHEILLPQARPAVAANLPQPGQAAAAHNPLAAALDAGPSAGATLNLLQEALQELGNPARTAVLPKDTRGAEANFQTNAPPPPPVRGAPPAAQPIAAPTIAPDGPLETTAHHLLDDTDAAIARQTLLQVASLPDRIDNSAPKADMTVPRWNFEIPFATPQGTAMAQFEISRDSAEQEVEATKQMWRARFSLDVEPAGPVHALISLQGETTSVRIWAERASTAEQLRAGATELSQALSRAELQPGDIVIREGTPPQAAAPVARAGHFLDRAL